MFDLDTLKSLRERVLSATAPDDLLNDDLCIALQFAGKGHPKAVSVRPAEYDGEGWIDFEQEGEEWSNHTPEVTASIDEAVALVKAVLPGWWWKCGTCCVSDDACIAPDFNDPVHGERLKAQFFPLTSGSEFDAGFDVDRRPPGNVPLALLEALLSALIAVQEAA